MAKICGAARRGGGRQGSVAGPRGVARGREGVGSKKICKGEGKASGGGETVDSLAFSWTDGRVDKKAAKKKVPSQEADEDEAMPKKKKNRVCKEKGCERQPTYAQQGEARPDFCAAHR